jgi:hypothetical protein
MHILFYLYTLFYDRLYEFDYTNGVFMMMDVKATSHDSCFGYGKWGRVFGIGEPWIF